MLVGSGLSDSDDGGRAWNTDLDDEGVVFGYTSRQLALNTGVCLCLSDFASRAYHRPHAA